MQCKQSGFGQCVVLMLAAVLRQRKRLDERKNKLCSDFSCSSSSDNNDLIRFFISGMFVKFLKKQKKKLSVCKTLKSDLYFKSVPLGST